MTINSNNIAIAHKDYVVRGGGELVAEELARTFDAPIFVGRRNPACEPSESDFDIREVATHWFSKRAIDHGGIARSIAYMGIWQQVDALGEYDTIVTSGNEPLWYVPRDTQTIVAYTHSTPRWQYDLFHETNTSSALRGVRTAYSLFERLIYQHNVPRVDLWVANSDLVARRLNQYFGIPWQDIHVVYPPVDVSTYTPGKTTTEDYYLHVGRLDGPKRIDELVRAFNGLDERLVIAGDGPERDRLEALAGPNIQFEGYVPEDRKRELMAGAKAGLFNALNEDFGMVPIEYMAAGTPVLGVAEGFTRHQILDGENGYTFPRGFAGIREAVRTFDLEGVAWSPERLCSFAERFSVEQFRRKMRDAVADAERKTTVAPPWADATPEVSPGPLVADGAGVEEARER